MLPVVFALVCRPKTNLEGSLMSRSLGPVLNPMAAKARAVTLDRAAFLRELLIAALMSLPLPMVSVAGVLFYLHNSTTNLLGLAIGVILVSGLTCIPLIFYASLRLNSATLARERASTVLSEQLIHPPLKGPPFLRNSIVAGSVRSRIMTGFPGCLGFGMEFALLSWLTGGSVIIPLHAPIGVALLAQAIVVAQLLR